jgi:non-specific serine/threonine protein kinase
LEAALAKGEAAPVSARAKALAAAGYIAWEQGDYERSVALSEESLALSRKLGDTSGAAAALYTLGWAAMFGNETERASALIEEAVTLQRGSGDTVGVARSLLILGFVANSRRDHERAMALYEESSALARNVGDGFAIALSLGVGALAALGQGDHQRTRALCEEGLRTSLQLKMMHLIAAYLHVAASLAGSQGKPVRSAWLWGAAEAVRESIGTVLSPFERHLYGPYMDAARTRLDEAVWEAAWAEGKAMTSEEAVEYALSEEEPSSLTDLVPEQSPASVPTGRLLTRREQEVAVLMARGLTNRQVAAELGVSEHTAITHVRNILKKLGFHSRARISDWVMEQRPLP